jgi:magnesium-transporting ATPase (P-type)
VLVGAAAIGAFLTGRAIDPGAAQTIAFATIACGELLVVFSVRSPLRAAWREPPNRLLLAGVAASTGLVALAIYLPVLHEPLGTVALDAGEMALVLGFALIPAFVVEVGKAVLRTFAPERAQAALRTAR